MARTAITDVKNTSKLQNILTTINDNGGVVDRVNNVASYYILRQLEDAEYLEYNDVPKIEKTRGRNKRQFKLTEKAVAFITPAATE